MKRPSFLEGAAVALTAALTAGLSYNALAWAFSSDEASRLLVAGVGLGYLAYLLHVSAERVGRVTTLALWLLSSAVLWAVAPPLPLYLLAHLGMIWLARSLYFHTGLLAALADLALTGLSLVAGVGAYLHSGSLFLAVWSLFLVQALFTFVPARGARGDATNAHQEDRFQRAHLAAEAAVRKLSVTN